MNRLLVFADDWGRHPSSCQHLVKRMLDRCQVTWVNTIGTRSPRLDMETAMRAWEKVRHWRSPGNACPHQTAGVSPRVLNPRMWPRFSTPPERLLNQKLLARFLRRELPDLQSTVLLTTIPIVADLLPRIRVQRSVYYCVDDFSTWPGLDAGPLRLMESRLIERADRIVAAGDNLAGRIQSHGREAMILTHGVDLDFWAEGRPGGQLPAHLSGLPRPCIVFWGLIDRRLDVAMLEALARKMDCGRIVLVGPQQDPPPQLSSLPNLTMVGALPLDDLPGIAAQADVLIMPYADLPVTRAMQPLKLKEYLATGKPVVTSALPAVDAWRDCLDVVREPEQFAAAVQRRLAEGLPESQRIARHRLSQESWDAKARLLESVLFPEGVETGSDQAVVAIRNERRSRACCE